MKKTMIVLSLLLISSQALAESYYCVVDQVAGFEFNTKTKEWSSTRFAPHRKYVLKNEIVNGESHWSIYDHGDKYPHIAPCEENGPRISVICDGLGTFKFSFATLRFLNTYEVGYWSDNLKYIKDSKMKIWNEGQNTPYMEIGKCTKID